MAGLSQLVNSGNTFEGKTIKLGANINLNGKMFEPIGHYDKDDNDRIFKGTLDGQLHTIKNLSQSASALGFGYDENKEMLYRGKLGLGLFGMVQDAQIINLTIDSAHIFGDHAICGTVAATAYGNCVFKNIAIRNTYIDDYNYYAGGVVGWASGNHQYININIDRSTTVGQHWFTFDNQTGGVIGGCSGSATIFMKDCTIACRLDVFNDVTAAYEWHAYRNSGMLIGNPGHTRTLENGRTVADAPQLTCENVKVIYGDWANYHYCQFSGRSYPWVRRETGYYGSYKNPRYGSPKDANGKTVVDDNHVHKKGDQHFALKKFDQLYGGGKGVYGWPTHEGVTVIYNNK